MRQFLASVTLGAALVGLAACTGNTGSANLVPNQTPSSLGAYPASLGAYPASLGAYPATLDAYPATLDAYPASVTHRSN